MSKFKVNSITDKSGYCGPVIAGVSTNNSTGCMIIPAGPTENRGGRGRGVFASGFSGAAPSPGNLVDTMDFVEIATTGNALDFGDQSRSGYQQASVSSSIRGIIMGGANPSGSLASMGYVTISSQGGANDYGDLRQAATHAGAASNNTRGIIGGGYNTPVYFSTIDYVTIATTGDSMTFGSLSDVRWFAGNTRASTTRLLFIGGATPTNLNIIEFIEIPTLGDSQDFGELSGTLKGYGMGCGNCQSSTRTVTMGGWDGSSDRNDIHYLTFATKGDSIDFGDLLATTRGGGSNSNKTRGILAGGRTPTQVNTIQYITIASTGNAQDFGDLTSIRAFNCAGMSDAHGGLER